MIEKKGRWAMTRLRLLILLVAMLSACSKDGPQPSACRRDSTGIFIVESTTPLWGDSSWWTIDPDPVLDLASSGSGPAHEFHRAGDATRLSDGSIAVADRGSSEIRIFSYSGDFVRALGRDGEGPGEFRGLTSVDRYRGDSLVAFDLALERATVFDLGDGPPRLIRLALPFVMQVHPLENGALVGMLAWPSVEIEGGDAGLVRMPVPVVRFSPIGEVIDTLIMSAGHEEVRIPGEYGFSSAMALFGKQSHVAAKRDRTYLGSADLMQFEIYENPGTPLGIVRVPNYDLSLSAAEVNAERAMRLGENPSPRLRTLIAALPEPTTRPAYSKLLVDTEGCVWAERHVGEMTGWVGEGPRQWEVFDNTGQWLGIIQAPARFTMFEIGADYILGVFRDELDVEHVQVFRLHRG